SRAALTAADPGNTAQMQLTVAVSHGGVSPAEYAEELVRSGKARAADGRSTSIGGYPAWLGRLRVAGSDGVERLLVAGFVEKDDQRLEVLGLSAAPGDANEDAIFASIRSIRPITDPARLAVRPNRVHV